MDLSHVDHFVLTVRDIPTTCEFYARLGMEVVTFGDRKALQFGQQKINLHQAGQEIEPKAQRPTPGSADFCLLVRTPIEAVVTYLESEGIAIESDIVSRTGATGKLRSIYIRDPDGNLLELSNSDD
ncbi:VOC family protein [Microcoleus sp. FACHB-1515]|uniref:VOC family protein n=1 Tax=Leptolyngbya sp. FACHB-1515 TaxID=2933931 RepID=UPI001684EE05|nr:VOC family protein [Microcoleus sp. FACHB-1515]